MTNATDIIKHSIAIALLAIIITASADEAKSGAKQQQQQQSFSGNYNAPLSSSSLSTNDAKQQNKRLAHYASPSAMSSGFKPITSSYPTVSNFASSHHHQQPYVAANNYVKYPSTYNQVQQQQPTQFVSPSSVKYSLSSPSSSFNRPALSYGYNTNNNNNNYNNYHSYPHQLAYAASQPAAVSYVQSPFHLAQQIFAHQLPLTNYNVHQVAPLIHSPNFGLFSGYHQPMSAYHHPQPQSYAIAGKAAPQQYASTYFSQHQPQTPQKQQQHGLITSKPVALEAPAATQSSSTVSSSSHEVHHNQHGAVSYAAFKLPSAAALIGTPPPPPSAPQQHAIYSQQQQQQLFDYSKHLSSAYPLHPIPPANYYGGYGAPSAPYAHISRISVIPTPALPTPQVVSVSVVPTIPQKISLH